MKRLAAIAGLVILGTAPASATDWLICSDGGKASISVLAGSLGIGSATDFKVSAGDRTWSTTPGEGSPIVKGQAFETGAMLFADVMTPDMAATVAELRLFRASEGDTVAAGGTLRVPGEGAWAVSCSGP